MMPQKVRAFFELIKFEHSIFALPFAYLGLFVAEGGLPRFRIFLWVTLAMVAIRTVGMCLNRLIDQPIDAKNPRTKGRVKLIKLLSRPGILAITFTSVLVFIVACVRLNSLCLALAPIPILLVSAYPYFKKITWLSHFILGSILGLAPFAGWLASTGIWSWTPFLLTIAVATWVSGFDMFYALQDVHFDRANNLKSFPVRFGTEKTIWFVRFLHGMTILALWFFGFWIEMGFWYWVGWIAAGVLIVREHRLVQRFGLKKINEAFFNMNAWVSVVIFLAVAVDLVAH